MSSTTPMPFESGRAGDGPEGQLGTPQVTDLVANLPATVPFVAPDAIERERGAPLRLRLGANESAFGISPRAADAMRDALTHIAWYGDPECHDLRQALADLHQVPIDGVVVGSGIDDLLGLVVRTFVDSSRTVVASLGSYPTFAYHVDGYGGRLLCAPYRDDGRNDLDALVSQAHDGHAVLVYLANPDNPTGTMYCAADIAAFSRALPRRSVLVLDEAYLDFAPPDTRGPMDCEDPRVVRLRTFSKLHGLAGARIGYAVATKATIRAFDKVRLHFGTNRLAQAGALASLGDVAFQRNVFSEVQRGRGEYARLAGEMGVTTLPSAANFVAIDLGSAPIARAVRAALLERGVFVRMPSVPPIDRCIRVTVGNPDDRAAFGVALRDVWEKLKPGVRHRPFAVW
jgi:histidinol-phosphate aminotransferase